MKKVKVYIASPYTIGDVAINVKKQMDVADKLLKMDFIPFVPLLSHFLHMNKPRSYDQWLDYDLEWLHSCDCLLRLDGESAGADREVQFAIDNKIPVFYTFDGLLVYKW